MIKAIEISSYGSIQDTIRVPLGRVTLLHGSNGSGKTMICRAIATALTSEGPVPLQSWGKASSKAKVAIEFVHPTLGALKLEREFSLSQVAIEKEIIFVQNEVRVDGTMRPDISILSGLVNFVYLSSYHDPYSISSGDLPEDRFFQVSARFLGYVDKRWQFILSALGQRCPFPIWDFRHRGQSSFALRFLIGSCYTFGAVSSRAANLG